MPTPKSMAALALVLVALAGTPRGIPATADALRYAFRAGETNAYHVQMEVTAEGGVGLYDGHVILITHHVDGETGAAELQLRGNLPPRIESRSAPMPYRPPFMAPPMAFAPFAFMEIDATGRVLAEAGQVQLPHQAGGLGTALFVPLPPDGSGKLERQWPVTMPDERPRPGMPWNSGYPYGPASMREGLARMHGMLSHAVETASRDPQSAQITWHSTLRSLATFEGVPRLEAQGEGQAVFDREAGWLREIRFTWGESTTSETTTRRSKLAFTARLLRGEEKDAALALRAPRTSQTLTADEVRAALEDLNSPDHERRSLAMQRLQTDPMEPLPPGTVQRAAELLESRDDSVRWAAGRVVTQAASTQEVPVLLRLLKMPDSPTRQPAIEALGRLGDRRAIEPLVGFIARGENERYAAIEALKQLGPEAEEPVLRLFVEKNLETRRAACQILEMVGSSRSLETLRGVMLDPDRQLRDQASQAVGAIVAREN